MDCNIALLPEPDINRKAIRASEELVPLGTEFTLGPESPVAHVSLYMFRAKEKNLPKIIEKLETVAAQTETLRLESNEYFQAEGYIDADYQKTSEIEELQQDVLETINPLRDGLRPRDVPRLETATGALKENLEKWGHRAVGELFRPHLTLARFKNRLPIPLEDMGAPTAFSGRYPKLALFEMGPNGTCARKIKEFDLR